MARGSSSSTPGVTAISTSSEVVPSSVSGQTNTVGVENLLALVSVIFLQRQSAIDYLMKVLDCIRESA